MPIIDGLKFSCPPCIKGHRSAHCPHTDRPLIEVKKKGRPPSQCANCRELRRRSTASTHVKCNCHDQLKTTLDPPVQLPYAPLEMQRGLSPSPDSRSRPVSIASSIESSNEESASSASGRKKTASGRRSKKQKGVLLHGHSADSSHRPRNDPYPQTLHSYSRSATILDPARSFPDPTFLSSTAPNQLSSRSLSPAITPPTLYRSNSNSSSMYNLGLSSSVDHTHVGSFFLPATTTPDDSRLCYCGVDCDCPGCYTHDPAALKSDESGKRCGTECLSFGLCSAELDLPTGVSSIDALMATITESEMMPILESPVNGMGEGGGGGRGGVNHDQPQRRQLSLSALFSAHTSQLQAWPSASDLFGGGGGGGSLYNESNSNYAGSISSQEGEYLEPVQQQMLAESQMYGSMNESNMGVGLEAIDRWRTDLDSQAQLSPDANFATSLYPLVGIIPHHTRGHRSASSASVHDYDFTNNINYSNLSLPSPAQHQLNPPPSPYHIPFHPHSHSHPEFPTHTFDPSHSYNNADHHSAPRSPLAPLLPSASTDALSSSSIISPGAFATYRYQQSNHSEDSIQLAQHQFSSGSNYSGSLKDEGARLEMELSNEQEEVEGVLQDFVFDFEGLEIPPDFAAQERDATPDSLHRPVVFDPSSSTVGYPLAGLEFDLTGLVDVGTREQSFPTSSSSSLSFCQREEKDDDDDDEEERGRPRIPGVTLERYGTERPTLPGSKGSKDKALSLERTQTERPGDPTTKGFFKKMMNKVEEVVKR